jgi:hypothetical protein
VITYQTEKKYIKTNALIRRLDDRSKLENDDRQRHQHQLILTANKLNLKIQDEMNIAEIIEQEIKENEAILKKNSEFIISKKSNVSEEKIFVLENKRLQIIKKIHDQSAIEYFEIRRILKMMKRFFY